MDLASITDGAALPAAGAGALPASAAAAIVPGGSAQPTPDASTSAKGAASTKPTATTKATATTKPKTTTACRTVKGKRVCSKVAVKATAPTTNRAAAANAAPPSPCAGFLGSFTTEFGTMEMKHVGIAVFR